MSYKGLTWKSKLFLAACCLAVYVFILFACYAKRGYLRGSDIIGTTVFFVLGCLLLVFSARFWANVISKEDPPDKWGNQ